MTAGFVAVLLSSPVTARSQLLAAGATAVLTWRELRTCGEPDDAVAVLLDLLDLPEPDRPGGPADQDRLNADLAAALAALAALEVTGGAVVATTRPVTDTLKLVDAEGTLTGTADRDDHRFLLTPIAVRLRPLRDVAAELPDSPSPISVLTALARRGATVVASAP
jgi:hypothetical protein